MDQVHQDRVDSDRDQGGASGAAPQAGRNEFVASFARGLSVLRAFGPDHRAMTLSEVAERARQTRASARRFLLTLVELGYMNQSHERYSLTTRALMLAPSYLKPRALPEVSQPLIEPVARELGETASVGILAEEAVEIVAYGRAPRQMSLNLRAGDRLPLFSSAQGRALLTGLPDAEIEALFARQSIEPLTANTRVTLAQNLDAVRRARRDGCVILDEELEEGVRSIAMPIRDADGAVIAAMSTCAHANRATVQELVTRFRPVLARTIARIEAAMAEGS